MKLMKKTVVVAVLSAGCLSMTACSSLFGDNERTVHIHSTPAGAKVAVNQVAIDSKTPTEVVVKDMWSPTIITVQKPGCQQKTVTIKPEFQPIGLLNIFVLPGFVVDAITGDMMKIPEDQRNIDISTC